MDANQIMNEHTAVKTFIVGQDALGRPTAVIKDSQHKALCTKIEGMRNLAPEDATRLSDAFEEGPWTDTQKCELATRLATKLSSVPGGAGARKTQSCLAFENFYNAKRMMVMKSDASITIKIETAAEQANAIGIVTPNEQTLGRITAGISVIGIGTRMETASLHEIKCAVSDRIKALDKKHPYPHGHITDYPITPQGLSKEMWDHAYGTGDDAPIQPPGMAVVTAINVEASRKFLRGSSGELKRPAPQSPLKTSTDIEFAKKGPAGLEACIPMLLSACMHAFTNSGASSQDTIPNLRTFLNGDIDGTGRLTSNLAMFRSRSDQGRLMDAGTAAAAVEAVPTESATPSAEAAATVAGSDPAAAAAPVEPTGDSAKRPIESNPLLDLVQEMAKANAAKRGGEKVKTGKAPSWSNIVFQN